MDIHVLTLFPEMFTGVFEHSMPRIAQEQGQLRLITHNLRDWSPDAKHHKVDDTPYGGGPGMVIKCDCVFPAVEAINARCSAGLRRILLTPAGRRMDQKWIRALSSEAEVLLIAGRYEGFDERIIEGLALEEVSIGDYVLSGGEIAAMAVIDAVARLLPGVLGDAQSAELESFEGGLLDYPVYTRPALYREWAVPEVLLSGHEARIKAWRLEQARRKTAKFRGDLLCGS